MAQREEDIYDYQIGLEDAKISNEDKHFFDVTGYLVLNDLLSPDQLSDARSRLANTLNSAKSAKTQVGKLARERRQIIELGGVLEDAMALPRVLEYVTQFIWGRQFRLVGSRAIINGTNASRQLSSGGREDSRRFAAYRCFGDGQFRCLMLTCMITLHDTTVTDGAFCCIPSSHKANLPHPYQQTPLDQIPPLRNLPLTAGSAVLITESLSHALRASSGDEKTWLAYHYGPSYMVDLPGCSTTDKLQNRCDHDPTKAHLLQAPYYHPSGAQKIRKAGITKNENMEKEQ